MWWSNDVQWCIVCVCCMDVFGVLWLCVILLWGEWYLFLADWLSPSADNDPLLIWKSFAIHPKNYFSLVIFLWWGLRVHHAVTFLRGLRQKTHWFFCCRGWAPQCVIAILPARWGVCPAPAWGCIMLWGACESSQFFPGDRQWHTCDVLLAPSVHGLPRTTAHRGSSGFGDQIHNLRGN